MQIRKILYEEIFSQDSIQFFLKNYNRGKLIFQIEVGNLVNFSTYSRIGEVIKYLEDRNFKINHIISDCELPKNISNKYIVVKKKAFISG